MISYEKLLQYALRILAKKRYTVSEMQKKLLKISGLSSTGLISGDKEDLTAQSGSPCLPVKLASAHNWQSQDCLPCSRSRRALASHSFSEVPKTINRLLELKYLDDRQYAQDYISQRIKLRPRGQFLLIRELKNKGISAELIVEILELQNINEGEVARTALEKRLRQWQILPMQKQREKAFRFLSSRGFKPDAIYKAVNCCYASGRE